MNRSSKGFGLSGVLVTVVLLIVVAIFSASAKSANYPSPVSPELTGPCAFQSSMQDSQKNSSTCL